MARLDWQINSRRVVLGFGSFVLLIAMALGWLAFQTARPKLPSERKTESRLAYVDGTEATEEVANFYRQYIDPETSMDTRRTLLRGFGTDGLAFYSQYYQHGFDPITCSVFVPKAVTTSLVSTGPTATVNAVAEYTDGRKATIVTTVVLTDRLLIDSVTCPGSQGHLPPR